MSDFYDVSYSDTYYSYIDTLAHNDITVGFPDGTFKKNEPLTRAQFSVFLARVMQVGKITEFGNLKGTVTWQYNHYIGTKPDVNAKVFLIPTNFNYTKYFKPDLGVYSSIGVIPEQSNLYFAKVNGYGQYEITNIPVGTYIAVISSKNTTRNPNDELYIKSTLEDLLGTEAYKDFELFNLKLNKYDWKTVEIKSNQTLDFSTDFGYTYY